MLTALELYGFKSFPDKTRFEFPPGITVVVGPNGSGKSNIVDAMKWVLGEQSAKSLRGKEMADVIFKGSARGKRKPANTAEATIIFDNSSGLLPIEAAEVRVTRRVYRSGEGEYLINGQASRLRDIKDLFRGTGVGTDAYSLIEQGKVDSLLRASPKDRRAIFEEAAGISRFKAKKVEAQRRLERVEQNLLRLSDIVDEVETRLKRVKSQASKAQRYKEYTARLQSLRTQVGRVDWQRFSSQIDEGQRQVHELTKQQTAFAAELELHETQILTSETELSVVDESLRHCDARRSQARERNAACHSLIESQHAILSDLEEEVARYRDQLMELNLRNRGITAEVEDIQRKHAAAQHECEDKRRQLAEAREKHGQIADEVQEVRRQTEERRRGFVEKMRTAADFGNRITAHETALASAEAIIQRAAESQAEITAELESALASQQEKQQAVTEKRSSFEQLDQEYRALREQMTAGEQELESSVSQLNELQQRHAALEARTSVLEEIEQRLEGVGSGVKEVLEAAQAGEAPFAGIRGMVADLVQVIDHDLGRMIDIALGERSEHLVVAGQQLFDHLERFDLQVPGRVGFLRLQSAPPPNAASSVDLTGQGGVIGRADRFVHTTAEYEQLVGWLLRDTWLVESLADAIHYHRSVPAPIRLVTRKGELLDRDGRLVVGPNANESGIISRRAELRQVREMAAELGQQVELSKQAVDQISQKLSESGSHVEGLSRQRQALSEALTKLEIESDAAQALVARLETQLESVTAEHQQAEQKTNAAQEQLAADRSELVVLEQAIRALEATLADDRTALSALEQEQETQNRGVTEWQITVAKSEQQLDALQAQRDQLDRDHRERLQAIESLSRQLQRCYQRHGEAELKILAAGADVAEMALVDEGCQAEAIDFITQREQLRVVKQQLSGKVQKVRQRAQELDRRQHDIEIELEKLRHQRDSLSARLHEDYGIDVANLMAELSEDEAAEREVVDQEIDDLRRKINNLGAVNMDALADLNELDERYQGLANQYNDLMEAKESLQRIIVKINADSRRLFAETLEIIRTNFSQLFRKVFGGGTADIVLEEGVDILESGIDLVATPPGKHSLGLSLLSGGERALTAVTLLLAIFEYRPSPFCVLDEVDGPLDEANIGRFVDVLREFLKWTKFVVVTHSKRTMTAANTLYGVTMQESGVSKKVAVRFEDVREGGEITEEAIQRSEAG